MAIFFQQISTILLDHFWLMERSHQIQQIL